MYLMLIFTCADGIHSYVHMQMRTVSISRIQDPNRRESEEATKLEPVFQEEAAQSRISRNGELDDRLKHIHATSVSGYRELDNASS